MSLMPHQKEILKELHSQGTWRLALLTAITLGVYVTFYLKRQSLVLNEHLPDERKMPMKLVWFFVIYSFVGVLITAAYIATPPEDAAWQAIEALSKFDDLIYGITSIILSTMAVSRLNEVLG